MGEAQCNLNTIKIAELEKRLDLHVRYQKEAVDKAALELRERLHAMNEFREQLKDEASRFVTRDEVRLKFENMSATIRWSVGVIASVVGGAIGSLVAYLLK